MRGAVPPLSNTPPWRGAVKAQGQIYLSLFYLLCKYGALYSKNGLDCVSLVAPTPLVVLRIITDQCHHHHYLLFFPLQQGVEGIKRFWGY